MDRRWRIELLGGLRVAPPGGHTLRLQSQKVGVLLAYLAYHPQHPHPREVLIELLWPEIDPETGRHNLRSLLHLLRRQFEPPGTSSARLLVANRTSIGVDPAAFTTDVADLRAFVQEAAGQESPSERARLLTRAVELSRGELLPGFYEPWVFTERQQLTTVYLDALQQLVAALEQTGEMERAIEYARRAVRADPLREEAHYDLMRLYAAAGQPSATVRQYQELERLLQEELGETPTAATRALMEELRQSARTIVVTRSAPPADVPAPAVSPLRTVTAPPSATPDLPAAPPLAPGLPAQFTRFFGREEEITVLTGMLRVPETRLLTLTGPGGSGKTRLAIAVAGRLQEEFAGAVWFVPLGELTEAWRIPGAVRDAMGLPVAPGGEPLAQVVPALAHQRSLLVLDNFEQLVEEGTAVVRALLERAPLLTCLVTSRLRLHLAGEQEFMVLPLPVPGVPAPAPARAPALAQRNTEHEQEQEGPTGLLRFPSVALFVDRAQAAWPGFQLTTENTGAVAALCRRLEGLPLAIELAAARSGVLAPEQMLARLERRLELLVSPRRDVSARHRSLRAAFEWSYQLLPRELQRFFARLSIFHGGWTLEEAEAVCSQVDLPEPAFRWGGDLLQKSPPEVQNPVVLEHLGQLRDASLIVVETTGSRMRYRLLETVREFAAAQLTPEEHAVLARRHLLYFMPLAHESRQTAPEHLRGAAERQRLREIDAEYENLRAALEWALQAEPAAALWLAAALASYWQIRGYWAEALQFLPRAATWQSLESMEMRAKALRYAGDLAGALGDTQRAREWLQESMSLSRRMGDPEILPVARRYEGKVEVDAEADRFRLMGAREYEAAALLSLGEILMRQGDYEAARACFQQSLELRKHLWSQLRTSESLACLGAVALAEGDEAAARRYYEQSLSNYREAGRQRQEATICRRLAEVLCRQGELDDAQVLLEKARAVSETFGDLPTFALTLKGLGDLSLSRADLRAARCHYQESLTLLLRLGQRQDLPGMLERFAHLAHLEGRPEPAARLFGAACAMRDSLGFPLPPAERPDQDAQVAALREALGPSDFAAAWEAGRALSWEQAAAAALAER